MASEPKRSYLAIDLVLQALIGARGTAVEFLIAQAEAGERRLLLLDSAIYCAIVSVRDTDKIDFARFARLLRYATIESNCERSPNGFGQPTLEEIEHWRKVALAPD